MANFFNTEFIYEDVVVDWVDDFDVWVFLSYVFDFVEYPFCRFAAPPVFVEDGVVAETASVGASSACLDVETS